MQFINCLKVSQCEMNEMIFIMSKQFKPFIFFPEKRFQSFNGNRIDGLRETSYALPAET